MNKMLFLLPILLFCFVFSLSAVADMPEIGDIAAGFQLESIDEIATIHSTLFTWRHEKTGALLCHIANDDTNRAFTIAFHTPVMTDTGLPHVFEHAALGGSEKYPDPNLVFSMMYGTYSSHMNAYTSTTYTAFQTASLSEEQLLSNMDVYLDGVFHPLLLSDPHAMMRDAYRYELQDAEGELSLQGVVYSEMLGAMSHTRMTNLRLRRLLWPGSYTGSLSGGMPDRIPDMKWQDLKDFHACYYTPGNSLTVLYGDLDIERFLSMIGERYFSAYEEEHPSLEDIGYRTAEGEMKAIYTYPAPADTEPETILVYAVPVGRLSAEMQAYLEMGIHLMAEPEQLLERRMTSELNQAVWSFDLFNTRAGSAIVFTAEGLSEEDAPLLRSIIVEALDDAVEHGFAEEDLLMYADSQRYANAVAREALNGVNLGRIFASYWDLFDDPRSVLPVYSLENEIEERATDGQCIAALREVMKDATASVLLVSTTEPGGSEQVTEARIRSLQDKKDTLTREEIESLLETTREYETWAKESRSVSMLSGVTAVTLQTLPEEVAEAEAAMSETDGLTVVSSILQDTDYVTAEIMLDLSGTPKEDLLPLRIAALLLGSLETGMRDRQTLARDQCRIADGLRFGLRTLENYATGEWRPVFSVEWATFDEYIRESAALVSEILSETCVDDLEYIRSILQSDALSRRKSYTVTNPENLAILEARRQTDEPTAWALLSGGVRLIEYEEALAAMDDEALTVTLQQIKEALTRALKRENMILTAIGSEKAISELSSEIAEWTHNWTSELEDATHIILPEEKKGNALILVDTNVSYNMEYLTAEETDVTYTEALSVFTNFVTDKVLMPVLRYQNSVYSVFFEISRDETLLMTYRDPNFKSTFDEIFPSLGNHVREALQGLTQEELDGYTSGVYAELATQTGPIGRASLAVSGLLQGRDYFAEKREAMRELKTLTPEKLVPWTELLDRLHETGLKVTVTGPDNKDTLQELFTIVNSEMLK